MSTKNNEEKPIEKDEECVQELVGEIGQLVEELEEVEKTIDKELAAVDENLNREVIEIISEQLGIDPKDVTPEKAFNEDLAADSLDQTELIMTLEEKYSLEISESEAEDLKKVKDVICYINTKTNEINCIS